MLFPPAPLHDRDLPGFIQALALPGLFDVHVHAMPPQVMAKVRAHFDSLHDPNWPLPYRVDGEAAPAALAALGVRYQTALAYAHRPVMAAWLNDYTLALSRTHPSVVPSFTFYPEPGVAAYVDRALAAGGRCAKVHLQVGAFDAHDRRLDSVWAELERQRVVVVIHAGAVYGGAGSDRYCGPQPIRRLVERFPDLVLVVAHMGAPHYAEFLALAEAAPTVHLDTTMAFSSDLLGRYPRTLIDRLAPLAKKVLLGSDFPSIPHSYAHAIAAVASLDLGRDWLRRVLWGNGVRLFGLAESA